MNKLLIDHKLTKSELEINHELIEMNLKLIMNKLRTN
jgi:hypothetical protein